MGHDESVDLVPLYVLDALPEEERRSTEEHLRTCCDCSWDAVRFLLALLGRRGPGRGEP